MKKEYGCPIEVTIDAIGGRWKPWILWQLKDGCKRFGELKKAITGITTRMLTNQLRELKADGVINRKIYPEIPPKVEYSMTKVGKSLDCVLEPMLKWGQQYMKDKGIKHNKEASHKKAKST